MFWPQLVRGCAIMFCILPPTQLALGQLAKTAIADASGLFNLMRNLGGAIGIAIIDTVISSRAPAHAKTLISRLAAGQVDAPATRGLTAQIFGSRLSSLPNQASPRRQGGLRRSYKRCLGTDRVCGAGRTPCTAVGKAHDKA
jgi:DHA2 family multidrug resistance protein